MWGYKAFIAFDCTVRKGYKPFPTCLVLLLGRVTNPSLHVWLCWEGWELFFTFLCKTNKQSVCET
ncbi:hypothetical protein [uncultured Gammaproteobacteria bacterium]|nr:hypothetical protein [uncultured Gammaproteobacteria bacterium]